VVVKYFSIIYSDIANSCVHSTEVLFIILQKIYLSQNIVEKVLIH